MFVDALLADIVVDDLGAFLSNFTI